MNSHTCPRCRKPLLPDQSLILVGTQWAHVDCESSESSDDRPSPFPWDRGSAADPNRPPPIAILKGNAK
jgi:hypothetical protein